MSKKILSILLSLVMVLGIFAALPFTASAATIAQTVYYNNHTYELFSGRTSWKQAKEECENRGGYLAVVNSAEENSILASMASGSVSSAWLGGSDEGTEGEWYWVNGDPFTYTKWNTGEPNNANENEHYLQLSGGSWNDIDNNTTSNNGYICEYDYIKKLEPVNTTEYKNHKYELFNIKMTWMVAKAECEKRGGHLATVTSAEENEILNALTDGLGGGVWLGGTDEGTEGNWRWITDEELTYTNWADGEPNSGTYENYLELFSSGEWNDHNNNPSIYTNVVGFICEYDSIASVILGDVDGDEEVTVLDATFIQRYEAGFNVPISEEDILARGDVDGDEEVTVLDATYIQRYDAGFNTPYPIGEAV